MSTPIYINIKVWPVALLCVFVAALAWQLRESGERVERSIMTTKACSQ